VFTSASGANSFLNRAAEKGVLAKSLRSKIAAVGPATSTAVQAHGQRVAFTPSSYLTKRLALLLLLVRAEGVDASMATILRERGARVEEIYAYRVNSEAAATSMDSFDAVLFCSPSAVANFASTANRSPAEVSSQALICCIGPVTARKARELGFRVDVTPREHTVEGLIQGLLASAGE
jgi:uroporphyrinogen-III synthase